jgi:hypothetical protein
MLCVVRACMLHTILPVTSCLRASDQGWEGVMRAGRAGNSEKRQDSRLHDD